jgi:transposase
MIVFSIAKGFHRVSKNIPPGLTQKELDRLRAITIWQETRDISLVCNTFGISRATLYRWIQQFDPKDLCSLKEQSRRPKRLRQPRWDYKLIMAIKKLREQYP